ncbi:MAG TPA: site-2 protease family protein [Pseudomonadota bacterium]|nr:site-2 protease family protein [Pseudomonadota bacterium]
MLHSSLSTGADALLAVSIPTLVTQLGLAVGDVALRVVISVTALIMCVTVHEFGHAFVADRLGDPLPRRQGRVTLNPIAHIDPLGTLLFPALMAMGASVPLAWGKPVEWTGHPANLTRRFSMRTIRFFVAVAGPGMNLILAVLLSAVFLLCSKLAWLAGMKMCLELIAMNFGLMFFNLLPIPPLDGRVFLEYLPDSLSVVRDTLFRYGQFIFLALILLGGVGGTSPLSVIMAPFQWLTSQYLTLLLWLIR